MKRWIAMTLLLGMLCVSTACMSDLGKIPTAEAMETETEEQEIMPEEEEQPAESAVVPDEELIREYQLFEQAMLEEEQKTEQTIRSGQQPPADQYTQDGIRYGVWPTYGLLVDAAEGVWSMGSAAEPGYTQVAPQPYELSFAEAVQKADAVMHALLEPEEGYWMVQYVPVTAQTYKGNGRAWFGCSYDGETKHSQMRVDAVSGELLDIQLTGPWPNGEILLQMQEWEERENRDTTAVISALAEARQFAGSDGPQALAEKAAQKLGLAVQTVEQLPDKVRLPKDGDPDYQAYMEERAGNADIDAFLYNKAVTAVRVSTQTGETYTFFIDAVNQIVKQIYACDYFAEYVEIG